MKKRVKRDFNCVEAYPLAKAILYRHPEIHDGIELLLESCSKKCRDPYWKECRTFNYDKDLKFMTAWLRRALTHPRNKPSKAIEILWLGILDVEEGFNLRGSSSWSYHPDNWQWCAEDNYKFRDNDPPQFKSGCLSEIMYKWTWELADSAAKNPMLRHIAAFFATLTYAGLAGEYAFKNLEREIVLGGRKERWFAVGHPDSEYGIILGKRTLDGWTEYRGQKINKTLPIM